MAGKVENSRKNRVRVRRPSPGDEVQADFQKLCISGWNEKILGSDFMSTVLSRKKHSQEFFYWRENKAEEESSTTESEDEKMKSIAKEPTRKVRIKRNQLAKETEESKIYRLAFAEGRSEGYDEGFRRGQDSYKVVVPPKHRMLHVPPSSSSYDLGEDTDDYAFSNSSVPVNEAEFLTANYLITFEIERNFFNRSYVVLCGLTRNTGGRSRCYFSEISITEHMLAFANETQQDVITHSIVSLFRGGSGYCDNLIFIENIIQSLIPLMSRTLRVSMDTTRVRQALLDAAGINTEDL